MILEGFRERRYINKHVKKNLPILYSTIEKIREHSDVLTICPSPTGSNWQGVLNATNCLFPDCTFVIPQNFSIQVYTEVELKQIAAQIDTLEYRAVVFSGFPEYFHILAESLKTPVKAAIFHGALSEVTNERNQMRSILNMAAKGSLHRIGFIKKGLDRYFAKISLAQCFELPLKTILPGNISKPEKVAGANIGVFGNAGFNKNIHNQVAAALSCRNASVHVICDHDFSYIDNSHRVAHHGYLGRESFLSLLGGMDINSHISFSESWGQIVTESLALGVPCLSANNNGIFDHDDFLAEKLIVTQYDNPVFIADQLDAVLNDRDVISKRGVDYIRILNQISEMKLAEFLRL